MRLTLGAILLIGLISPAALGQSEPTRQPPDENRVLKASRLPKKAHEVRTKGVPDADVKDAIRAGKSKGLKAGEMADVADAHARSVDEHGPTDNFGAFVRSKLDEGLRGRELAAAIRAEHARNGKGKGKDKDKAQRPARADDRQKEVREKKPQDRPDAREREARDRAEREARERAPREQPARPPTSRGRGKP
jgi:hypothetical protein